MMKKWMLKRTGAWMILAVFLFAAAVSMAGLELEAKAAASDFVLTHTNTSTISPGDVFSLPLRMRTTADNTTISGIQIDFSDASIVSLTDGGTLFTTSSTVNSTTSISIGSADLRFIGDGSTGVFPVTVNYMLDTGSGPTPKSAVVSLSLNVSKPSTTPSETDFSKYKPNLQVGLSGNNGVAAGSANSVTITIRNISTVTDAKNVLFVPVYDKDSPFVASKAVSAMPISQIAKGGATEASISIDVDKFAEEGTHPFNFKLAYANPWNYEFTTEYTVYIKVTNNQSATSLELKIPENQPVKASAGGTFTLPLTIRNNGTMYAKDVKVALTGLSQDTFMLSSGTGRNDFYKIYGNESYNLSYTIKASASLKTASYPLSFKIEYVDEKGTKITEEQQVWIPVVGNEDRVSMLEILEITPSKTSVKPGEAFDVAVKIKNSGDFESKQIKVSADGTSALLPVSQNLVIIPSLKKGETRTMTFKFQPQPEAARGGVAITIKVDSVEGGQTSSIAQAVSVFIDSTSDGKPEAGKNVPKIIVKSYSSEPTLVKAGEKFTLNLEFLNTHSDKTVRNIKGHFIVTEGSNETGNVFSPVDCSNTFYIDEISPKGTYDWTLTLFTIPDAKSKTYTVTISFEYEDEAGNPYKADEIIGIPVYQPARFETSEITLPPETFMGQPVFLGFEMYNMGKTDIYNVKLKVEGDFDAQPKSNYFGNFESGRREYFELNLVPTAVGQAKGRIVFEYETSSGEKQEYVKEFAMNVMEMQMPSDMPVDGKPMDPGMEKQQQTGKGFIGSVWFFVAIGVVAAGIAVAVILVVRKRKKDKEFDF